MNRREILFRGKRTDNGEWVVGDLIHGVGYWKKDKVYILPRVENLATLPGCDPLDGFEVDPSTVGQFTGLLDKNGVNIWEGDIFTANEYPFIDDGEPNYNGVVEWIFNGFQYVLRLVNPEKIGISDGINEYLEDGNWLTVIGNIHDNPELTQQS